MGLTSGTYKNLSGRSTVVSYQRESSGGTMKTIVVTFKNREGGGGTYFYGDKDNSQAILRKMSDLAFAGKGLNTFINKHKPKYWKKI